MIQGISLTPKSLVIKESLPFLVVGRSVVATVLGKNANGLMLVSLFGKRVAVETPMELKPGQVLNLKVDALSPRIVLKMVEGQTNVPRDLEAFVDRLVGRLGSREIASFNLREIFELAVKQNDAQALSYLSALLDEFTNFPQALALFFIPVIDDEASRRARVAVEKDDEGYLISFEMDTDRLGLVEATARLGERIDVEIRAAVRDSADFLRDNLAELYDKLQPLGVGRLEVVHKASSAPGLDMLV